MSKIDDGALRGTSPPTHLLQCSDILFLSEKLKSIRIKSNEISSSYCLQLFQIDNIPPRKSNHLNQSEGIRKSFKQPFEKKETGEITMRILITLLNIFWGHLTRADLEYGMVGHIRDHLKPDIHPLDYMIQTLYSYLFSESQEQQMDPDSDEEFERATKALSKISTFPEPPSSIILDLSSSLCPSGITPSPLPQRLLDVLRTSDRPLKALDIARELKIPKAEVNHCLYKVLSNEVRQRSDHTWISISSSEAPVPGTTHVSSVSSPADQLQLRVKKERTECSDHLRLSKTPIKLESGTPQVNHRVYAESEVKQPSVHNVSSSETPIKLEPQSSRGPHQAPPKIHSSPASDPLQSQIESYLRCNPSPCDAKTIRRALSVPRTKAVNQRLYELHRKRKVERSDDEPPLWRLLQP
jgi:hypothetical protein